MEIRIEESELKEIIQKHFNDSGYIVSDFLCDVKFIYEESVIESDRLFTFKKPQTNKFLTAVSIKIGGIKQNENE